MEQTRARTAAVVAVLGVVIVVGSWLQPAGAHVGTPRHVWNQHIRSLADQRYLQNSSVYISPAFSLGTLADLTVTRLCPSGMQAIGGGVDFASATADVRVISDAPIVSSTKPLRPRRGQASRGRRRRPTMHNNGVLAVGGVVGVICSR